MVSSSNKIIGACIALMMEQYKKRKRFALPGVLFIKEEIITCANTLFPMNAEVRDTSLIPSALQGNCLQTGSDDSLHEYFRLYHPNDDSILRDTLNNDTVAEVLEEYLPNQFLNTNEFITTYFEFIEATSTPSQERSESLDSRAAVWIAAATLTYNEYVRTKSNNLYRYAFQAKTIDYLARRLVVAPPLSGFNTLVSSTCTKGTSRSSNPFLIAANDSKRRIAQHGEVSSVRPNNLPMDFIVNAIDGRVSVKMLVSFMDRHYTAFTEADDAPMVEAETGHMDAVFFRDVYMKADDYEKLLSLLNRKKNVILQGAPGTGKTFCAKKLVKSILGDESEKNMLSVQFHQGYSYEDFVEGYRPRNNGYVLEKGAFLKFCNKARSDGEHKYFVIIDELNRGNISKIFGELFTLLEKSKRGEEIKLLYSGKAFSIPENVYVIGLMNTADRSLAMIDYALRRRFGFFTMKPAFDTDGFKNYKAKFACSQFDSLIEQIKKLNKEIAEDDSLGEGFCIGHSFFCELNTRNSVEETKAELKSIVENEIIPLLEEYWYDERTRVKDWEQNLRGALS